MQPYASEVKSFWYSMSTSAVVFGSIGTALVLSGRQGYLGR